MPGAFDDHEVNLLTELAADLSFGIVVMRDRLERQAAVENLQGTLEATVAALASTVECRDPYTAGHQRRVAKLACAIALRMGLGQDAIKGIELASIIHDIGKIRVPAEILNKPGKLSHLEFNLIKEHSQAGYEIVRNIAFPWPVADMILQHHERLDGSGYPRGISAEEILVEARIIAVADTVDSMMSHRPYRVALGLEAALAEIERRAGQLYDRRAVEACVALFRQDGFVMES